MENNKKSDNRLIFFEPNCSDTDIPNTEDLSILVELRTTSKSRSTLADEGGISNEEGSRRKIGFIDGTNVGGGRRSLTTNYTQIGTDFFTENKFGEKENDLESLGIESIDISFDTAYTPMIKIKFIDIRGNAVLEKGTDSKYKMFFELPFPLFELTVQGFYGKAVTYCLHLTKWNASFNSGTGNFEIDTEFIGYTYALLTDCLLGYMRATAYTTLGKQKFLKYKEMPLKTSDGTLTGVIDTDGKVVKDGDDFVKKYPNLMTIDEFIDYTGTINDEFAKIKVSDENIKQLNALSTLTEKLDTLEGRIDRLKNTSISDRKRDLLNKKSSTLTLLSSTNYSNDAKTKIDKKIEDYQEGQKNAVKDINKSIDLESLKINIDELNKVLIYKINYVDNRLTIKPKPDKEAEEKFIIESLSKYENKPTETVYLFDFKHCYDEINRVKTEIRLRKKVLDDNLTNTLKNKVSKLKFKPTIKNVVDMLSIHAQVFLETLNEVSIKAEDNTERGNILRKLTGENDSSKTVYPWLEYNPKDDNNQRFEKWIGSDLTRGEYERVNEVVFVEDLLANLMKIGRKDELIALTGSANTPDFFPVSPAEAKIRLNDEDSLITKNPYYQALKSNRSAATPQEAIRCLLFRIFTSFGVTNRLLSYNNHVPIVGKLEADNLFNLLNSEFDAIQKKDFIDAINDIASGGAVNATKEITETWSKGGEIEGVTHPGDPNSSSYGKFFTSGSTLYTYTYITGNTVTILEGDGDTLINKSRSISYIPISGGFDGKDFFKGNEIKKLDELKELSDSLIFTSDYFGTPFSENNDDGSLYFKILVNDDDYELEGTPPLVNSTALENYKEKVGPPTIIDEEQLLGPTYDISNSASSMPDGELDMYNGIYQTLQIDDIIYQKDSTVGIKKGKDSIIKSYFYQDTQSGRDANNGGTYLARNNISKIIEDKTLNERDEEVKESRKEDIPRLKRLSLLLNTNGDYKTEYVNLFTTTDSKYDENQNVSYAKCVSDNLPNFYGSQKQLITEAMVNSDEIYIPFVDYSISNIATFFDDTNKKLPTNHFSLFGSIFYYEQKKDTDDGDVGKAFLFLHSIAWEGVIGDVLDSDNSFHDVSLFDLFDEDEDETFTIKGLYGNNGSIIRAPKLWCAFIGALLYRYDKKVIDDVNIINYERSDGEPMFPWQEEDTYLPKHDEYLHYNSNSSECGIHIEMNQTDNDDNKYYGKVDQVILNLPKQVRDEFKRIFISFVNNDFTNIQKEYELFKDVDDLKDKWTNLSKKVGLGIYDNNGNITDFNEKIGTEDAFSLKSDSDEVSSSKKNIMIKVSDIETILGTNDKNSSNGKFTDIVKNYINISPINDKDWDDKNIYQFDLSLRSNDINKDILVSQFGKTYHIMNATPRVFRPNQENYRISVDKRYFDLAIQNFFERFAELTKDPEKEDDKIQQKIFNNIDDDIIKLNIYRTLSSINDKWLGSKLNKACTNIENIVDTFRFLDSGFLDIGDEFLINPLGLVQKMVNNYNQSFFDLVNGLLIENNFNFIALPSYIDFNTPKDMKENIFTPYAWSSNASKDSAKAAFICVYTGQKSSNLDLGKDSEHEDDGFLVLTNNCEIVKTPELFETPKGKTGFNIPYFSVSYAKGNQSIFKDIKLDQREFIETAESLEIIDDLSQNGNKNKATAKGQNLFNVYQKRAYSAEVEMMGNVTIQPMMYFQLTNIPMFRGAYLIYNTSHSITAHNMKTTFKGNRIKKVKTPLITEAQLFQTLIGSVSEGGEAETITNEILDKEPATPAVTTKSKVIII